MKIDKKTPRGGFYKKTLYMILSISMLSLGTVWIYDLWNRVPSNIHVMAGKEQGLDFCVPATAIIYKNQNQEQVNIDLNRKLTFYGETEDTYTMQVDLFGLIPFKEAEVCVIQEKEVAPLGYPVGIYVKTEGVLVIDTGNFVSFQGKKVSPAKNILLPGDYICKINEAVVDSKEGLINHISQCEGKTILLEIRRDGFYHNIELIPQKDKNGEFKLGIWVRDNAQGIGTLTFSDENGCFGALGHGINDVDTAALMEIKEGGLYKTDIISVTRGVYGSPGELTGVIAYSDRYKLGEIKQNTKQGVYGVLGEENLNEEKKIPIALKQEIKKGDAQILCTISTEPELFDIKITDIYLENDNINRGLEIQVTDQRLLEVTGGIVQGMSGSPIIQDGKLVGAVTHVLVNDPTRGYGIFIENMLEAAK